MNYLLIQTANCQQAISEMNLKDQGESVLFEVTQNMRALRTRADIAGAPIKLAFSLPSPGSVFGAVVVSPCMHGRRPNRCKVEIARRSTFPLHTFVTPFLHVLDQRSKIKALQKDAVIED